MLTQGKRMVLLSNCNKCSQKRVLPNFILLVVSNTFWILCLVMDIELGGNTISSNIEYPFVSQLMKKYLQLKAQFVNGTIEIFDKSGWRDDMKFLYYLTHV